MKRRGVAPRLLFLGSVTRQPPRLLTAANKQLDGDMKKPATISAGALFHAFEAHAS